MESILVSDNTVNFKAIILDCVDCLKHTLRYEFTVNGKTFEGEIEINRVSLVSGDLTSTIQTIYKQLSNHIKNVKRRENKCINLNLQING